MVKEAALRFLSVLNSIFLFFISHSPIRHTRPNKQHPNNKVEPKDYWNKQREPLYTKKAGTTVESNRPPLREPCLKMNSIPDAND
jgi:hypothetical protein